MQDLERMIGKLDEARENSKIEFNLIRGDLADLKRQVVNLSKDSWILYGKIAVFNSIFITVLAYAFRLLGAS